MMNMSKLLVTTGFLFLSILGFSQDTLTISKSDLRQKVSEKNMQIKIAQKNYQSAQADFSTIQRTLFA